MSLSKRAFAELLGTFWLVFGGCGAAVLAAAFPNLGIGFAGVALAFGLTVLTMAYAIGHISGCHLNPAVSTGLVVAGRFPAAELLPYVVAQLVGGIAGSGVLYLIASGKEGFPAWLEDLPPTDTASTSAWRLLVDGVLHGGSRADVHVPDDHPRRYRRPRAQRLCADRYRPGPDIDSPDRNTDHQPFREPCPQYGPRDLRRRLGAGAALDVLGCPDYWGVHRGRRLLRVRGGEEAGSSQSGGLANGSVGAAG